MNSLSHTTTPKTTGLKPPFKDANPFLVVSPQESDGGNLVGANPLFLAKETLLELGHPPSPIKAIRAHCLDCSGGDSSEARKCTAISCRLWPLRMGKNVYHAKASANG